MAAIWMHNVASAGSQQELDTSEIGSPDPKSPGNEASTTLGMEEPPLPLNLIRASRINTFSVIRQLQASYAYDYYATCSPVTEPAASAVSSLSRASVYRLRRGQCRI